MSYQVHPHQPLITQRVKFRLKRLPPLTTIITLRQDFGNRAKRQVHRSRTPYDHQPFTRELVPKRFTPDIEERSDAPDSDLYTTSESASDEERDVNFKAKIPKPPGEAGRKNCGGFNLEGELGWGKGKYNKFTKFISELVSEKLDKEKSFSNQKPDKIRKIIEATSQNFDIVDVYENDWPIREALKLRLKYTSDLARRQAQRKADDNLKKVVRENAAKRDK